MPAGYPVFGHTGYLESAFRGYRTTCFWLKNYIFKCLTLMAWASLRRACLTLASAAAMSASFTKKVKNK